MGYVVSSGPSELPIETPSGLESRRQFSRLRESPELRLWRGTVDLTPFGVEPR